MIPITIEEDLKKIRKDGYSFSSSIINKAIAIYSQNRVKLVSPPDARGIRFHICPVIEDTQKKGYEVVYLHEVDEWMCDCRHEVYRTDRSNICSHILVSMYFWKELNK
jgi:hypothetical protein